MLFRLNKEKNRKDYGIVRIQRFVLSSLTNAKIVTKGVFCCAAKISHPNRDDNDNGKIEPYIVLH